MWLLSLLWVFDCTAFALHLTSVEELEVPVLVEELAKHPIALAITLRVNDAKAVV